MGELRIVDQDGDFIETSEVNDKRALVIKITDVQDGTTNGVRLDAVNARLVRDGISEWLGDSQDAEDRSREFYSTITPPFAFTEKFGQYEHRYEAPTIEGLNEMVERDRKRRVPKSAGNPHHLTVVKDESVASSE